MQDSLYHRFIDELAAEMGSAIPDASRLRRAATILRNDWAGLRVFLKAVASDPSVAASIARRSYWHANGFAKLVLHDEPAFSLRLHIWPAAEGSVGWSAMDTNAHTHRWEFASMVLCGSLTVDEYEEAPDVRDPKARVCDAFRYDTPEQGMMGRLVPLGTRALRATRSTSFGPGDVHDCELETIHAVAPFDSALTATLFVQGPVRKPAAFVYQEVGREALKDTGVAIDPEEAVELVEATLDAMSYTSTGEMRSLATSGPPRSAPRLTDVVLADHEIIAAIEEGSLRVDPFDPAMVRPAALSLQLGTSAYVLRADGPVDAGVEATYPKLQPRHLDDERRFVINPGEVVLAPTLERITIPDTLVGVLDGTTDIARLGLSVVLAQQVSPGFGAPNGAVLTLEIVSHLEWPIYLRPATRVCNLLLLRCVRPARLYSATPHNHSDDLDATSSRLADHCTYDDAGFTGHTAPFRIPFLVDPVT